MTNDAPSVAPGWYAAGVPGQERWWSGVEWTEHLRPAPYSEKWDRPGWGKNPEAMVVIAIVAGVVFLALQPLMLGFLFSGDLVRGIAGFLISLGLPAFAIVGVISARIGFRRKREGRPAAGEPMR